MSKFKHKYKNFSELIKHFRAIHNFQFFPVEDKTKIHDFDFIDIVKKAIAKKSPTQPAHFRFANNNIKNPNLGCECRLVRVNSVRSNLDNYIIFTCYDISCNYKDSWFYNRAHFLYNQSEYKNLFVKLKHQGDFYED